MLGAVKPMMAAKSGLYTPPWANVKFLAHLDEANGATTFAEKTGKVITNPSSVVTASNVTMPALSGVTTSAYFNGTTGRLSTPGTTDLVFGGDYTIEFYVLFNVLTGSPDIIGNFSVDTTAEWMVLRSASRLQWYPAGSAQFCQSGGAALVAGQWYYVRCVRKSSVCTLYVDDVASAPVTVGGTHGSSSKVLNIGCRNAASNFLNGYMSNIRITNGVAIPSQGIPTAPWPDA